MTRTTPSLQQHLLTRSDFARMGVPAAQILAWLATNTIEQVGSLGETGHEDPVFTVAGGLRAELTAKLAMVGKTTVVLSPLRVRSFLLRAMLAGDALAGTDQGHSEPASHAADPQAEPDLADVIQDVANHVEADVEAILQLAREEAMLDANQMDAAATLVIPTPANEENWVTAVEPTPADQPEPSEFSEAASSPCFNFEDLASELDDLLGGEPIAEQDHGRPNSAVSPTEAAQPPTTDDPAEEATAEQREAEEPPPMEREANTATDTPAIDAGIPPEPAAQAFSSTDTPLAVIAPPATEPESIAAAPIPVAEMSSAMTNEAGPVAESVDVTMDEAPAIAAETADPHVEAPQTAQEPTSPVLPLEPMPTTTATAVTANEPANEEPAEPPSVNAPQETLVSVGPATEAAAMQRVESFLDQLKGALIEMAQRPAALATSPAPPSPSLDIAPLVAALQAGFDRSAQMSEASSSALSVLAEKVASFGEHVEQGVQRVVADLRREPQPVERQATEFVITRSDRTPIVLFAVAALVIAWSGIFWFKTGSTRLAFSTLVGANVVGCCLLAAWRRRV